MVEETSHTDADSWAGLKNDDPQALGHLYDAYVDKLFLAAMRLTDDRELAKDALQEVFIEVWTYRKSINEIRNTNAYLTKILRNILFRKFKVNTHLSLVMAPPTLPSPDQNAEELIISSDTDKEKQTRLQNAISVLTKRQKQILELRFYEGMSYEQIAKKLGMNYQSVNNLAFRTFRRLRNVISTLIVFLVLPWIY